MRVLSSTWKRLHRPPGRSCIISSLSIRDVNSWFVTGRVIQLIRRVPVNSSHGQLVTAQILVTSWPWRVISWTWYRLPVRGRGYPLVSSFCFWDTSVIAGQCCSDYELCSNANQSCQWLLISSLSCSCDCDELTGTLSEYSYSCDFISILQRPLRYRPQM